MGYELDDRHRKKSPAQEATEKAVREQMAARDRAINAAMLMILGLPPHASERAVHLAMFDLWAKGYKLVITEVQASGLFGAASARVQVAPLVIDEGNDLYG